MIPDEWIENAVQRLNGYIRTTPITFDNGLDLFLKWENQQVTESFKARGAFNKVLSLQAWELAKGLVTCSAGNHGQGVALAAKMFNTHCKVFVSDHASRIKVDAMQKLGADIKMVDGGYAVAEREAIRCASEEGLTFISPYNDVQVIAGQGTLGVEIGEQLGGLYKIKNLLVPVGGGGLISGIGAALEGKKDRPKLIGVQSTASPYAHAVFHRGNQEGVLEEESLADGLAGEIDHDSITIPMLTEYVDDLLLVSEEEIRQAMIYAWKVLNAKIEGSAAVGLAARLAGKIGAGPCMVILTGGNIDPDLFSSIVESC